ncbi:MAG: segregation/condensation protein A [Fibrobacter sp.]|jgi:chromatin segregation and condensation protein Rec8/ScpA/Scc1 (kleisin family)|nr:segregation/condensation protein A [Fibrobacter sp.]
MSAVFQEEYEVRIRAFEGPMDLLLYLVQKNEVPVEQISIAEITDQFLLWMKDFSQADLSAAGDFLYMASRLMAMKVRELLPKEEQTDEEIQQFSEDREELLKQMLEYQRFKKVATDLQSMESDHFGAFYRGRLEKTQNEEDSLADATVWQLLRGYQKTLKSRNRENIHHVELDYVTIEDRQQFISNYLARHGRALFEDILGRDRHPIVAVVSFMALLEMNKTDEIVFRQSEPLGAIWLYRKKGNAEFHEEMANEHIIYSRDPELREGLVRFIHERETAIADKKRISIDAVMREAVLWVEQGRKISDDDIMNLLSGQIELSEKENPDALSEENPAAENAADTPTEA